MDIHMFTGADHSHTRVSGLTRTIAHKMQRATFSISAGPAPTCAMAAADAPNAGTGTLRPSVRDVVGGFKGLAILVMCLMYAAAMFTLASVASAFYLLVGGTKKEKQTSFFLSGKGHMVMKGEYESSVYIKQKRG